MFAVDDCLYTESKVHQYEQQLSQHPIWQKAEKWRIAVCPEDIGKWIMLLLYLKKKGASIVPIHPDTPISAAKRTAERAGCFYLFFHTFEAPLTLANPQSFARPGLVQFSSGTTGEPKRIDRSWESIDEELDAYVLAFEHIAADTIVVACPVTHSYGLISGVLAGIKQRKQVLVVTAQNPKYVLKKLNEHPNHLLYAAPPLLYTIAKLAKGKQHLHAVMTSGTRLPDSWFDLIQAASETVMQQYGCSEAGCISVAQPLKKPSEMGAPLSHVRVKAGNGQEQASEIQVVKRSGAIKTGDLGYFTKEGTLCFVERIDDMINVAGLNVYPHEVERVLCQHHAVDDAVVYKKEHPFSGEQVCAQVAGDTNDLSLQELRSWCLVHLAPYQVPQDLCIVQSIPKGANGKINRKQLGEAAV